jgi:transcriptional regulator NrdR family protein
VSEQAVVVCACGARSKTIDARLRRDGTYRRRRECEACGARWSTLEVRAPTSGSLAVIPTSHVRRLKDHLAYLFQDLEGINVDEQVDDEPEN